MPPSAVTNHSTCRNANLGLSGSKPLINKPVVNIASGPDFAELLRIRERHSALKELLRIREQSMRNARRPSPNPHIRTGRIPT